MKTQNSIEQWRRKLIKLLALGGILALGTTLSYAQSDSLVYFNPAHKIELGINATATLSTFVGNETVGISPADFPIVVKFMQGAKAAWRLGLGVELETLTGDGVGTSLFTETQTITAFGRVGYEWRKVLAKRWMFLLGVDVLGSVGTDNGSAGTQVGFTELKFQQWGVGGGPAYGIQFAINPRIHVGTEGNIYATFLYTQREERFEFDPQLNNSQTTEEWDLRTSVPQWLYVTLRL